MFFRGAHEMYCALAFTCSYMLLHVLGSFYMLLHVLGSFYMPLHVLGQKVVALFLGAFFNHLIESRDLISQVKNYQLPRSR